MISLDLAADRVGYWSLAKASERGSHKSSKGEASCLAAGSRPTDSSKLRQFVRRDLEAILHTEDTLTFAVVMDLAAKSGLDRRGCHGAPVVSHEEAVNSLRRYLGSHAGHFWHEVRHAFLPESQLDCPLRHAGHLFMLGSCA